MQTVKSIHANLLVGTLIEGEYFEDVFGVHLYDHVNPFLDFVHSKGLITDEALNYVKTNNKANFRIPFSDKFNHGESLCISGHLLTSPTYYKELDFVEPLDKYEVDDNCNINIDVFLELNKKLVLTPVLSKEVGEDVIYGEGYKILAEYLFTVLDSLDEELLDSFEISPDDMEDLDERMTPFLNY